MSGVALGPIRVVTAAEGDLEGKLPSPNSLRRAGEDARRAVAAGAEALGARDRSRVGLYVAQQLGLFEYSRRFIDASYDSGPRLVSPLLFSEAVANNAATHLSLTLGLKGAISTFIGSRVAGIQAVMAAAEDVDGGVVETGLVVVLAPADDIQGEAYAAARRRSSPPFLRGAAAFLLGEGAGPGRLELAAVACSGRDAEAALALLWGRAAEAAGRSPRILPSAFGGDHRVVAKIAGDAMVAGEASGEAFALDPFLRLRADLDSGPAKAVRVVACVSEEGTAGVLVVR